MQLLFDRMLADRFTEGRREGQELGLKQGQEIGRVEGVRAILLHQLHSRFGALPSTTVARIEACADLQQLQQWSREILTAPDLEALGLEG